MSIYTYFYRPFLDQKDQKPNQLCQICSVFECVGTDIVNMEKIKPKPTKRARDLERVSKAEVREAFFTLELKSVINSP